MNRRPALALALAAFFSTAAAEAQTGEALRAEIAHELARPLAADVAGLEAQVLRLQMLLRQAAAVAPAPAAPAPAAAPAAPAPGKPSAGTATEAAESRPSAPAGTAAAKSERLRALLRRDEPGGGDPTRPDLANPKGYVYLPATGGDQANAKPQDARTHMAVPFKKPKRTAGGDALKRTFPSNGGLGGYGGGGFGGYGGYGGGSVDPRFGASGYGGR